MSNNNSNKRKSVVAELSGPIPYIYNSLTGSPDGRHALLGGKDILTYISIKPSGIEEVKTIRIGQYLQASRSVGVVTSSYDATVKSNTPYRVGTSTNDKSFSLYDTFGVPPPSSQNPTSTPSTIITTITSIAWSSPHYSYDQGYNNNDINNNHGYSRDDNGTVASYETTPSLERIPSADRLGKLHSINRHPSQSIFSLPQELMDDKSDDDSLIAVAASNGVTVIWRATDLLGLKDESNSDFKDTNNKKYSTTSHNNNNMNNFQQNPIFHLHNLSSGWAPDAGNTTTSAVASQGSVTNQPEAIFVEHTRSVTSLAWHPNKPGLLLTASQDSTVILCSRKQQIDPQPSNNQNNNQQSAIKSWFGGLAAPFTNQSNNNNNMQRPNSNKSSFYWSFEKFKPNCGAVLDIKWNPYIDDLFAIVTNNGFLVVYNVRLAHTLRHVIRIAAHAREATSVDWHPIHSYVLATGGVDRTVKVWDLETELSLRTDENVDNFKLNFNSNRSYQGDTVVSQMTDTSQNSDDNYQGISLSQSQHGLSSGSILGNVLKRSNSTIGATTRSHKNTIKHRHELAISAQVEKVKWRPPRLQYFGSRVCGDIDHHDTMLAVSTAPISGTASGDSGFVGLFSSNRPFMPLSVIDGHKEGAVIDFLWIDTPNPNENNAPIVERSMTEMIKKVRSYRSSMDSTEVTRLSDTNAASVSLTGSWQHILSVGKDGRVLLQSLVRGDRPIFDVSPSIFALANLSPFQSGFGSLQLMTIHQKVPSGYNNEFLLCGLRQDEGTSLAPGVFREYPPSKDECVESKFQLKLTQEQKNLSSGINIIFTSMDHGHLDELKIQEPETSTGIYKVHIAPEVVHLSRFAKSYKLHVDDTSPNKVAVCRHNAKVAEDLKYIAHARMWILLATLLEGCSSSDLKEKNHAMTFLLQPTLRRLLLERAEAGDVQHCVVICEVIMDQSEDSQETSITGIERDQVREWYLSYIELLQQMCLFSHATELIRNCHDAEISKLSQQSTTIHESCPCCWKPIQRVNNTSRQTCGNCRNRIGACFLCHQPVKGIYVFCVGCGHGGHIEHALEWFGSNETCPTGCGHKCNLSQHSNASCSFPRTESLIELEQERY